MTKAREMPVEIGEVEMKKLEAGEPIEAHTRAYEGRKAGDVVDVELWAADAQGNRRRVKAVIESIRPEKPYDRMVLRRQNPADLPS